MKRLAALLLSFLLLAGCGQQAEVPQEHVHADAEDNGVCDTCNASVIVPVDFYSINDLHGKLTDGEGQPGVEEMTTYLKSAWETHENMVLLSAGDMWQGSSESNLTAGNLTTEWMNEIGFNAMALGNHEFDWGEEPVRNNSELAQFPFLAINIYNREKDTPVDYCQSSLLLDLGEVQIGIIGAIGDCYSSIAAEQVEDIYFKTGDELTQLVMLESTLLRENGADYIVYMLHDGYEESESGSVKNTKSSSFAGYYDTALSDGYVDLVFEGHTHQRYILRDVHDVYHMQNKGENKGISHVTVNINSVTGSSKIAVSNLITSGQYATENKDPLIDELLDKYSEIIAPAYEVLGNTAKMRNSTELRNLIAQLYYEKGVALWGDEYDIVLGGGFISVRSPYDLPAGEVIYGQLQMIFPFDNHLVLCSIKGKDLQERFFEEHKNYYISCGQYGQSVQNNLDPNATYYVVVDSYSSVYGPNKLTEITRYEEDIFARDLLADYIRNGGFE